MPINPVANLPQSPRFDIIISGLCAVCFSEKNQRAEIGFLNVENHNFELRVYEEGLRKPIYDLVLNKNSEIKINADSKGMGFSYCPDDENSKDDFRQMIDLHKIYDENLRFNVGAEFFSKMYISDAVFYTYCLSRYPVTWFWDEEGETQTRTGNRIGKVLGAKIENPRSGIEINTKPLDKISPENNYLIEIRFRCDEDNSQDLLLIYDVINGLKGRPKYGLFYDENESPCFLPSDYYRLQDLGIYINETLAKRDFDGSNRKEREKFADEMQGLAMRFRDRKACQNLVLSGVPIDLDGDQDQSKSEN